MPTAAMVFMGCTHIGASHVRPPSTLKAPAQKSAGTGSTPPARARPRSRGMKVPRSPREPDTSRRLKRPRDEKRETIVWGIWRQLLLRRCKGAVRMVCPERQDALCSSRAWLAGGGVAVCA